VYVASKDFTNPRNYQWSFAAEQALTQSLKITGTFAWVKGVHNNRFVNPDKNFHLSERFTLQAIFDLFNATNRSNPRFPAPVICCLILTGRCKAG
jgi:hypothetical protein